MLQVNPQTDHIGSDLMTWTSPPLDPFPVPASNRVSRLIDNQSLPKVHRRQHCMASSPLLVILHRYLRLATMEVLSDSFDPVSYSYETDTESTYEVSSTAVFFTSTPRGGHRVLPLNSIQSDSESGRSSPEEYHTVPTVNVDQDPRRRFMEWTFPNGHGQMPSIYRRHTFDHLNLTHSDETLESPEQGVASTFASRVGDLRAHLAKNQSGKGDEGHLRVTSGPSGMLSTRSSAEFPMRSPNKKLAVVNSAGEEQDRTADLGPSAMAETTANGWDEVALRHAELSGKLAGILKGLDCKLIWALVL
jgi:hypothetical protein